MLDLGCPDALRGSISLASAWCECRQGESVRRQSLRALFFVEPRFSTPVGLDVFFRELDDLLKDKAHFDQLHSVCFYEPCRRAASGALSPIPQLGVKAKMEAWLPHLHQRGILFVGRVPGHALSKEPSGAASS